MVKCNMGDVYKMEITENDVEIGAYAGTASFKIKVWYGLYLGLRVKESYRKQ